MTTALIIVDIQNDYFPGGKMPLNQMEKATAHAAELLSHTDILVDGPYLREQPDTARRWIGSTNQRIHFLTDRYSADDPRWRESNTLELRLVDGAITINGFPAKRAMSAWKRGSP